jgi:ubiquinone/menaquinone biosynthesis C-methylase UbiE
MLINECRCCGGSKLVKYLDLGQQPLANSYHKGEILDNFPLEVMLCENCFHSQLSVVVDPQLMFKHYLYVSGTTQTFRKHCKELAKDAVQQMQNCFFEPLKVLDIAANDGTLLSYFKDLGCEVQGVDPAENLRDLTEDKGIPVEVAYWGQEVAQRFLERDQKFGIITGTNVFAHVHDVSGFLQSCYSVLEDDGIVVLEFPYCDEMIEKVEFDTIYHEHVSYFLVNSFSILVNRMGFYISRVVQTEIHGGSIRFFLKKDQDVRCHIKKDEGFDTISELIQREKQKGLLNIDTYKTFSDSVERNKCNLISKIADLKDKGYKIVAFGASAKGNTMLNHFKIHVDYIVDDNPMKWDYLTPGQNIPIRSPESLRNESENLAIVILSWNFFPEIKVKIKNILGDKHHKCILYVPDIQEFG